MPLEVVDVLPLMRHMADVAALRSNPVSQRQTLIDGLAGMFAAPIGWFCVADHWLPGREVRLIHQVLTSAISPAFTRYMGEFTVTHSVADDPWSDHSINSPDVVQHFTRDVVLPDAAARARYADCVAVMDKVGVGDGMVCGYRTGRENATLVGFSLHRQTGDEKISPTDHELAKLAIREIRRLADRGHLVLRGHSEPHLSPRLNQVLDRLLSGVTPKHMAIDLDLSVWTVREHIKALYTHFGVSGREELMARFVGNIDPGAGENGRGDKSQNSK